MPVENIRYVTESIITLLEEGIKMVLGERKVLPNPPGKVENGIGFYLFHVQESAQHKNFPAPGKDQPPVRHTPMGLNLYYQLTANFGNVQGVDDADTYLEQEAMSVAMKTLHDYPEINDGVVINNVNVFEKLEAKTAIMQRGNRFKITLIPINYNEAVSYWSAGQSPMKLAAYYEVSMVFLEPEESKTYAGRVLQYGAFVFPEGAPRIMQSQNVLEFALPPDFARIQKITVQPAQVPYDGFLDFFGAGFQGDDPPELLLANGRWDKPALATGWELSLVKEGHIRARVKEQALLLEENTPVTVLPDLYAAQIRVTRNRTLPNGEVRKFSHTSNQFPITISPRITSVNLAGGIITVNGNVFHHAELKADDVMVYVGENKMPRDSALSQGTFRTTGPGKMEIRLPEPMPAGWSPGQFIPLRILVNGAESLPQWFQAPA